MFDDQRNRPATQVGNIEVVLREENGVVTADWKCELRSADGTAKSVRGGDLMARLDAHAPARANALRQFMADLRTRLEGLLG